MTQLRHCKCGNSNYFDRILAGIGHRGSSFSDLDAISHDHPTQRFLLQEFKREGERYEKAQHWMLRDFMLTLRKLPEHFTVWMVERRTDERFIGWAIYGQHLSIITVQEYQERFAAWWDDRAVPPAVSVRVSPPDVSEIKW